jgi:3-dehydroquinate dehydratase II
MNIKNILVLGGPNLNLLGTREPAIYGYTSLDDIYAKLKNIAQIRNVNINGFQSNNEGELIDKIHNAKYKDNIDYIIFNPAAFTHTSIALRDALSAVQVPFVEVHLSNVHAREKFRHTSYFSDIAQGVICGCGAYGYEMALHYILSLN